MEEDGAHGFVQSADDALGAAVLGRSVGTGQPEGDAVVTKESASGTVVKLTAIVRLQSDEGEVELSTGESVEASNCVIGIGFAAKRKRPGKVTKIIK